MDTEANSISTDTNMVDADGATKFPLAATGAANPLPLSVPPAAGIDFGRLCPLRVGFALANLSRLTNVPVEVLWVQFARVCERQDAERVAEEPPPVIERVSKRGRRAQ